MTATSGASSSILSASFSASYKARSLAPLLGYNGYLVCIQDRQETLTHLKQGRRKGKLVVTLHP